MIAELGHYALVLALGLALVQASVPIVGARKNDPALMAVAGPTAVVQFCFIAIAFAALTICYVRSDFSVVNVFENSHSAKPLVYKISGVWGNHEGSMLLWVLILGLFGALVALFGSNLPARLKANVLAVQSWIAVAFILFILVTSNPFLRIAEPPFEGRDLNPDPAGSRPRHSSAAALCRLCRALDLVLLRHRRADRRTHRRRLGALGAAVDAAGVDVPHARHRHGLVLGLLHAGLGRLVVLGSGGERLVHAVAGRDSAVALRVVMEKRNALKIWTILLAILAFSLSLIGTFLVRSGVLTSVHTFATDPSRGFFILVILVLFIGGGLALFALRAPLLKQGGLFAPVSREGALVLNNLSW